MKYSTSIANAVKLVTNFVNAQKHIRSVTRELHPLSEEVEQLIQINKDIKRIQSLPKSKLRDKILNDLEELCQSPAKLRISLDNTENSDLSILLSKEQEDSSIPEDIRVLLIELVDQNALLRTELLKHVQ